MAAIDRESMPYRPCAGAAVFNKQGLVWIGRRIDGAYGAATQPWQMPQGGLDKGEDPEAGARRELLEETNIRTVSLLHEAPGWILYDLPDEAIGSALKGKYRGQKQRWFAFLFEGDDSEIDVHKPNNGENDPEFDQWRWEELERLPDLIVPFKREAYRQIVAAFAHLPAEIRGR